MIKYLNPDDGSLFWLSCNEGRGGQMGGIFHKYDIRGIYQKELTGSLAFKIGRAIAEHFSLDRIVVGHDHRNSSPELFENLVKGLNSKGCKVLSIGNTATPILYRECIDGDFPIGVMLTASHNPKEYNGFKICTGEGLLVTYGKGLEKIEELVNADDSEPDDSEPKFEEKDALTPYAEFICSVLSRANTDFRAVMDAGNGVAGPVIDKIMGMLAEDPEEYVKRLYFEPDGNYPNHEANPLKDENLEDIKNAVVTNKADVGFAFDGDADRCIVIDEKGETINTDMLLCLIATEESKKIPGATFYYDLRFSKVVKEHIESLGCKALMSEVGNAVYKEKLAKEGGLVAAELSGHVMFSENKCLDDGFFLMAKVINYMADLGRPISELIAPYKKYYQSPEINMKVTDADKALRTMKEKFAEYDMEELDGVTIKAGDWWFNLRKSNTEPVVRMRVEAEDNVVLDEKVEELKSMLDTM